MTFPSRTLSNRKIAPAPSKFCRSVISGKRFYFSRNTHAIKYLRLYHSRNTHAIRYLRFYHSRNTHAIRYLRLYHSRNTHAIKDTFHAMARAVFRFCIVWAYASADRFYAFLWLLERKTLNYVRWCLLYMRGTIWWAFDWTNSRPVRGRLHLKHSSSHCMECVFSIALQVHHIYGYKNLIEILHSHGLYASYHEVRHYLTRLEQKCYRLLTRRQNHLAWKFSKRKEA
jgi:hypothetical protein